MREIFNRRLKYFDAVDADPDTPQRDTRRIMSGLAGGICFLLVVRYWRTLNLMRATSAISTKTSVLFSGLPPWLLLELAVCVIHSYDGLPFEVHRYETTIQFKDKHDRLVERTESVEYTRDTLVTFMCFAKVYLVFRIFMHWISFFNNSGVAQVH